MTLRRRTLTACLLRAWFAASMLVWAACHDPQSVERQNRRYRRIEATVASVQARNERRPRQIQWVIDTRNRQEEARAKHLQSTLQRISDRYDRDVRYVEHGDPVHRARWERLWRGHPENISDVWSRLVY